MRSSSLILVVAAALCTSTANLLLRGGLLRAGGFDPAGANIVSQLASLCAQPLFLLGLALYGTATLIWFRVLSITDVSVGYPILVSLTFVLVTCGSLFFFNEQVSWQKVIGLCVILAGVQFVARA